MTIAEIIEHSNLFAYDINTCRIKVRSEDELKDCKIFEVEKLVVRGTVQDVEDALNRDFSDYEILCELDNTKPIKLDITYSDYSNELNNFGITLIDKLTFRSNYYSINKFNEALTIMSESLINLEIVKREEICSILECLIYDFNFYKFTYAKIVECMHKIGIFKSPDKQLVARVINEVKGYRFLDIIDYLTICEELGYDLYVNAYDYNISKIDINDVKLTKRVCKIVTENNYLSEIITNMKIEMGVLT